MNELISQKIETLFKLSHSKSIKLRTEILKLIFYVSKNNTKNSNTYLDRYYKSLYEILLMKEIANSKHVKDLLKLIVHSLMFDNNLTRVAAFLKRLLQTCLLSEPSFITCVLIIVSQVLRNKHKLWKMLENPVNKMQENYDFNKRDPQYTNADQFPLTEIIILTNHYHPTVQRFSNFILDNYNKEIINYEGDPFIDFSLVNFLEKFMLKNAKLKSDKNNKKKYLNKEDKEEDDLKRFMEEDDDEEKGNFEEEDDKGEKFEFIKKFNEKEKVKSVKSKLKKKVITQDIDEYADQVMEDEYANFDKDIDDDGEDELLEGMAYANEDEEEDFNDVAEEDYNNAEEEEYNDEEEQDYNNAK